MPLGAAYFPLLPGDSSPDLSLPQRGGCVQSGSLTLQLQTHVDTDTWALPLPSLSAPTPGVGAPEDSIRPHSRRLPT